MQSRNQDAIKLCFFAFLASLRDKNILTKKYEHPNIQQPY